MKSTKLTLSRLWSMARREAAMRKAAHYSESRAMPGFRPLKYFSIVGSEAPRKANDPDYVDLQQHNNDTNRFYFLFNLLINSNIPVDERFVIDDPGLNKNRNWLKEERRADVVLISNVDDPDHPEEWARRINDSKGKLVISVYEGQEVDLEDMLNRGLLPDYEPLGSPAERYIHPVLMSCYREDRNLSEKWQIIGRKDFVKELGDFVGETEFAKDALRACIRVLKAEGRHPRRKSPDKGPQNG